MTATAGASSRTAVSAGTVVRAAGCSGTRFTGAAGGDAVSPDVSRTEVPAADAVNRVPEQPAAATTVPAEPAVRVDAPAVRDDAPAVAVMDELAAKRAKWWAMWTALPDPPAEPFPVDQGDQDGESQEAVRVGADSKESDSGSASS